MSHHGRRVVRFDFERRWAEGHRAGVFHRFERSEIARGELRSLVRELEPEFEVGGTHVIVWSRRQRVSDEGAQVGFVAPPMPLMTATITAKVRRKDGAWSVRFDTWDSREVKRLIRRKPPDPRYGEEVLADELADHLQSNYTSNVRSAVDHLEAVDDDCLDLFTKRAAMKAAQRAEQERALRERNSLEARIGIAKKVAEIKGIDISTDLRAMERRLLALERKLDERIAA